jgi:dihydrolipoamide dehydrogenase
MTETASRHFEVAVIGGGPAGYTAAIRAAQLGATVALFEKHKLGGACLNYACIPTKFLRYTTEILHTVEKASRYGITTEARLNWPSVQQRRQALIDGMGEGIGSQLEKNGVEIIIGQAVLRAPHEISVSPDNAIFHASKIILASGSSPFRLGIPGAEQAVAARDLLSLPALPRSLAIIGGGPVGIELATIFNSLGVQVSVIEMMPRILPGEDAELADMLAKELKRKGLRLYTGAVVRRIAAESSAKSLVLSAGDAELVVEAETAAKCVGQQPKSAAWDWTLAAWRQNAGHSGGRAYCQPRWRASMPPATSPARHCWPM